MKESGKRMLRGDSRSKNDLNNPFLMGERERELREKVKFLSL